MIQLQPKPLTATWVNATWEEYLQFIQDPAYYKAKGYYFNGQMWIEAMGVGADHAGDNSVIHVAITLFCALKGIPLKALINCSYRKPGIREAQPDGSYFVGDRVSLAPQGSAIVDLDQFAPPDLVIEIADSSLNDDLGKKRLLYEELNVAEYWVIDVENAQIIAFAVANKGSHRIHQSQVLTGLNLEWMQEAIALSRQRDDSQLVAWMMTRFQES